MNSSNSSMNKKALLLVNVGTPDKPEKKHVRRYLFQFLNDRYVIDLPWLLQKVLVNFIIIPFRVSKSTRLYKKLRTDKGFPLLVYLREIANKVQNLLDDDYFVIPAMRYGNPNLKKAIQEIKSKNPEEIVVLPLYPQYATSTTLSVIHKTKYYVNKLKINSPIHFIEQFYDHPAFIKAFAEQIQKYHPGDYDHILFSYHGLPIRQINKIHPYISAESCTCEQFMPEQGKYCYKATCFETTRLLVKHLKIPENKCSIGFQSRLTKKWMSPFTDDLLKALAARGIKKVLMVAPSFVADCLETIVEIGIEYRKIFLEHGGETLDLVESLNSSDIWAHGIREILTTR
jgi:protoporphyrin/coproporphyrin ferrochelatase